MATRKTDATAHAARPLGRFALAACLTLAASLLLAAIGAASAQADFGIAGFDGQITRQNGDPYTQAGGHPFAASTTIDLNQTTDSHGNPIPDGSLEHVSVGLPAGFVGDPEAIPTRCTAEQLQAGGDIFAPAACPASSQIGTTIVDFAELGPVNEPVYNMVPPPGLPAQFAFKAVSAVVHLNPTVRTGGDYGLTVDVADISQAIPILGTSLTIWGTPADPAHDGERGSCLGLFGPTGDQCPTDAPLKPFLTLPTACTPPGVGLETTLHADSWQGESDDASFFSHLPPNFPDPAAPGPQQGPTGCDRLPFDPSITVQPTSEQADSPTGLHVDLHLPQNENPDGLAEAHLKKATVQLPAGMAVNPSAADGLAGCTQAQIDLSGPDPATCPDASKVGSVEIDTPLLDHPLDGSVYLATQGTNPFNSLLALYIAVSDPQTGLVVKLPGKVSPDPQTGQLETTFDNNPQLPFSDLKLDFFVGSRASLVTPPSCGTYQVDSSFVPWSAADPNNPTPSEIADRTSSFDVTTGPGGGPCPDYLDPARFTPGFSAGTTVPLAGGSTGFVLTVTRPDGQQSLKRIHLDLPPGVVAKLAGVPRCPQSAITPGIDGSTSCPAGSQIGTVNVGAGAGSTPFFLTDQPVYLTDGYNGAPYGIAIDTHAVAGPLDLGHVVVRSTLNVDPDDAQVHIDSEQLPWILQGIPLHIRKVAVNIDKPGFMVNPTHCNPMTVSGTVTGGGQDFDNPADDTVKPVSDHFQVGGCGALGFSPHLSGAILNGTQGIHRSDHPNLSFNLHATPGDANLASAAVTLPQAFQIDQANLGNICSETQLANEECAGRNTVGTASARTPLLDSTLSGPVYAVSGSGGLPKLAVILNGPPADPVHLLVRGITDTVGARIRNTFPLVPDTPITDFTLTLNGGPQGYLVNNTNVCGATKAKKKGRKAQAAKKRKKRRATSLRANAFFVAQNGDTLSQKVPISANCPKAKKKSRHARHRKHH
ncbi:MAG: hypothetical protein J2O47_00100 [Acidimicrobiaceae bacterium]|nr:hypothetical protein [Acidimicrobiaceae bacterium]